MESYEEVLIKEILSRIPTSRNAKLRRKSRDESKANSTVGHCGSIKQREGFPNTCGLLSSRQATRSSQGNRTS
jgi:hypothetical protein